MLVIVIVIVIVGLDSSEIYPKEKSIEMGEQTLQGNSHIFSFDYDCDYDYEHEHEHEAREVRKS